MYIKSLFQEYFIVTQSIYISIIILDQLLENLGKVNNKKKTITQ